MLQSSLNILSFIKKRPSVQPRDADKGPEGAIAAAFQGAGVAEIAKMLWSF